MKKFISRFTFVLFLSSVAQGLFAQTTLYSENFDAANHLATGWYSTTSSWDTTASNPDTIAGSTGLGHMVIRNATGISGADSLITPAIATTGHNSIKVSFAARNTSKFADSGSTISLLYSINNGAWTPVAYTENTNNSAWMWVNGGTPISLPAAAANQTNIRLMWIANLHSNSKGTYGIDDLNVAGTLISNGVSDIETSFAKVFVANDHIVITQTSNEPTKVEIIDLSGQLVYHSEVGASANISAAQFSTGIYFVRISNANQAMASKIVLK